jgi:murein DD-endopeptidase MepM/ murein hydrolase activator NlpD
MAVAFPSTLTKPFRLTSPDQLRVRYFPRPGKFVDLTPVLVSVDWEEDAQSASPAFTVVLDNYMGLTYKQAGIRDDFTGGVLALDYGPVARRWIEWFRGTVVEDSAGKSPDQVQISLKCLNPLSVFAASKGAYVFKGGLTATQHLAGLFKKWRLPVGHLMDTKVKLEAQTYRGTMWDAFNMLLKRTRAHGGGRFFLEYAEGKLWLLNYDTEAYAYDGRAIITALDRTTSIEDVVTKFKFTSLSTKATGKAAKDRRAVTRERFMTTKANARALAAFGLIEVQADHPEKWKPREAKKVAKKKQGDSIKPTRTVEIALPFESLTLHRLQIITFPNRDPETRVYGQYAVEGLQGHLGEDGSNMTLQAARSPEFYDPQPTDEAPASDSAGATASPISSEPKIIGTPHSGTHTRGDWASDNAIDLAIPVGTPLVAVADGTIGSQIGPLSSSDPKLAGLRLHLVTADDELYYAHLSKIVVKAGQHVTVGTVLGYSGSANGTPHLHFASKNKDPRTYMGGK